MGLVSAWEKIWNRAARRAVFGAHAEAHVDIADLGGGGEGNHGLNLPSLDGGDAAYDHAADAQHQQNILHAAGKVNINAQHLIDNFDEQENIPLEYNARENAGGRGDSPGCGHPAPRNGRGKDRF